MFFTIGVTADAPKALKDLRAPSTQSTPAQQACENAVRAALADYLEANADENSTIGVSASVSCSYTPKS